MQFWSSRVDTYVLQYNGDVVVQTDASCISLKKSPSDLRKKSLFIWGRRYGEESNTGAHIL